MHKLKTIWTILGFLSIIFLVIHIFTAFDFSKPWYPYANFALIAYIAFPILIVFNSLLWLISKSRFFVRLGSITIKSLSFLVICCLILLTIFLIQANPNFTILPIIQLVLFIPWFVIFCILHKRRIKNEKTD